VVGDGGRRLQRLPSEHLRNNFYVTTSGNFSPPAFGCTLDVMGANRVMFSADHPMDENKAGPDFIASYPMDEATRRQVESGNSIALFGDKIPARLRQA
jgi:2,3-dihydroxybenzoate decarboxylase